MADQDAPAPKQLDDLQASTEHRIAKIVDEFISQLQAGVTPNRQSLEKQYADLAPHLGIRLAFAERVFRAVRLSKPSDPVQGINDPAPGVLDDDSAEVTSSLVESSHHSQIQAERAHRLRCPHCGNPIQVVETNQAEITCRVCGSSFQCDSNTTATHIAPVHPETIGRFQIRDVLGRGAFGVVYKAYDTELRRFVAIKVPRAGHFTQPGERERFLREARSVARLRHPQIVQVHEVLHEHGVPCIVSDFVDGMTLDDVASGRRVSFREAADYVARASEALDFAHESGVIHRDVKPSNMLVDHAGRLFLTDFGLARQDNGEITMTMEGEVLGTPAYMSPEQALGRHTDIDRRSDVYSLGVVLYRLLSGELPFRGSKRMTIHQVIFEEPRSLHSLNEYIPRDLETIALKAMSKEPTKRYATARELSEDLHRWLRGYPIHARPTGRIEQLWRWSRRHRLVASLTLSILSLLLLSAIAGAVWAWRERGLRREADFARDKESQERQRANTNALTSRQRLTQIRLTQGAQLLNESDLLGASAWYASAMEIDQENGTNDAISRLRLGTIFSQCPKLTQLWTHVDSISVLKVSSDGRLVLSASQDGLVVVWNAITGEQVASMRHGGPVRTAAFSPNGERVISTSADNSVILWSVANLGGQKKSLAHAAVVKAVAFSPDGSLVATGGHDKRVRLFDVVTGAKVGETEDHDGGVNGLEFNPEGTLLLSTTPDAFGAPGSLWLWKVPDLDAHGKPIASSTTAIRHATFSPDGTRVLSCGDDRTAHIWNVATGEHVAGPMVHLGVLVDGQFSPDGKQVLTASVDGSAQIWDAANGQPIGSAIQHASAVRFATFSPDGRLVATGDYDGVVRICDVRNRDLVCPLLLHNGPITGLYFNSADHRIVSAGTDGIVKLWDLPGDSAAFPRLRHNGAVTRVAFAPDGRHVLTVSREKLARWWDIDKQVAMNLEHDAEVRAAVFSPTGERFATGSSDGIVRIGNARTGEMLPMFLNHESLILDIAFNLRGDRLVSFGEGIRAKVWNVSSGELLASLDHQDSVKHASFSTDGQLLVTTSKDRMVRIWNTDTWQLARGPLQHQYSASGGYFSPNGAQLVTQSEKAALLWNLTSGQSLRLDHGDFVYNAKFSPDGRWIVTSSWDDTAAIWDAQTGKRSLPVMQHGHADVFEATFSSDGSLLATGSAGRRPYALPSLGGQGAAQVWDSRTADPITPPLRHSGLVERLAFSPDGHRMVTGGRDGVAKVWKLEPDNRPLEDLRKLAELLAARRVDDVSGMVPLTSGDLKSRWDQLRRKYPESFSSSPAAVAHSYLHN